MLEISVIVATHNRSRDLKAMLESLSLQECDFHYEIIIVDNNSSDGTKSLVESYSKKFAGRLKYLFEKRKGKSYALNTAIQAAKGQIVAFTDDDVIVDKSWLANIKKCFDDYDCDGLGGRILPLYPANTPRWIKDNKLWLNGPIVFRDYGEGVIPYEENKMHPFIGANAAYRKKCFDNFGVFRTDLGPGSRVSFGEDTEFFRRLTGHKKLCYYGKVVVWHKHLEERMNIQYVSKWFFAHGKAMERSEWEKTSREKLVLYGGIPRYLIKAIFLETLSLLFNIFNTAKCLKSWTKICWCLGKCTEYKKLKNKKNKIAIVVDNFPSISETFILNQITGLIDLGHDVDILTYKKLEEKKVHADVIKYRLLNKVVYYGPPENKIERLWKAIGIVLRHFLFHPRAIIACLDHKKCGGPYYALYNIFKLMPFVNKKYDVIHCHFGPNGNEFIFLKDIFPQIAFITSFHGYDINIVPKLQGRDVYKKLFQKCDLFMAGTEFIKQRLIDLGCAAGKIALHPAAVNLDCFSFYQKRAASKDITILTVGRLVEEKGYAVAIKSIAKLVKEYKNIHYIIAGYGPLESELRNLVHELNIDDYVTFTGGISQSEVISLYKKAQIFILPSVRSKDGGCEGQGLVLQEAQAMGIPVVSTRIGGIPDGVLDGKSGFLVPEGDEDSLAERIRYLIDHPELWTKIGMTGRKFVEKKYDSRKLNRELVEIYSKTGSGS